MQVTTGTVVNGKIEIEGMSLTEGSMVAVLARGADEPFELSSEDEDELLAAISEIERGEFVTVEELLRDLPR
jgi:hypothetical protein